MRIIAFLFLITLSSCSLQRSLSKNASKTLLNDSLLSQAHIGIALYDADANRYIYTHQSDKYFLPASNTKIFTCYAAMKYLGDSIAGIQFFQDADRPGAPILLRSTADPTFLHPDFPRQPVRDFLLFDTSRQYQWINSGIATTAWGSGWSWNDYQQDYMPERSSFPLLGNLIRLRYSNSDKRLRYQPGNISFQSVSQQQHQLPNLPSDQYLFRRDERSNTIVYELTANAQFRSKDIPFITDPVFVRDALRSSLPGLKLDVQTTHQSIPAPTKFRTIYTQHTDSLLKPMMHRSDNFFAEQTLLMVSQQRLGVMNDRLLIDTLLASDLKALPQRPNWVDGSGLSRYNLFTPESIVAVLTKMRTEFSWERIRTIFPTGGTGTIGSLYQHLNGKIFAKTGTLSGQVALSGYLITKKGHTIIFSILVNNHMTTAAVVRKAVANFLTAVAGRY
jgi:D-alanyl-D-alanine carboxypeptidase/D-alanyl-D-alanine-endopeptidase (penicillin-binding protein 4)